MLTRPLLLLSLLLPVAASAQPFYEDNPTYQSPESDADWTFRAPFELGLDRARIEQAAGDFAARPYSFSLLVVRHDAIAFERYFHGSGKTAANNIHSAGKTMLGAAVGVAIKKGLLRGPGESLRQLLPGAPRELRLSHLLSMTAGVRWREDSIEYEIQNEPNWVNAILRLPRREEPGRRFHYSTLLTHLLSAALTRATGESTAAFTQENLLDPLGIRPAHWGQDPQGISSGGYNMYFTPRDLARFGLLYLHGGQWKGRQLVPRAWVKDSWAVHARTRGWDHYDYGYGWWLKRVNGYDVKAGWGFGGQFLYVVPKLDLIVVMTTNTRDFRDPAFEGTELLHRFLLPAVAP